METGLVCKMKSNILLRNVEKEEIKADNDLTCSAWCIFFSKLVDSPFSLYRLIYVIDLFSF